VAELLNAQEVNEQVLVALSPRPTDFGGEVAHQELQVPRPSCLMNISNLIEDVGNRSNEVMKLIGRIKNNDKRLKKVDLEKKRIHWSDTEDLAPALATNNVVTHVTLAGCGIGKPVMLLLTSQGAIKFVEFLWENETVLSLNLRENMIQQGGAQALKKALKRNITLIELGSDALIRRHRERQAAAP
jgi:hypothetical protein